MYGFLGENVEARGSARGGWGGVGWSRLIVGHGGLPSVRGGEGRGNVADGGLGSPNTGMRRGTRNELKR